MSEYLENILKCVHKECAESQKISELERYGHINGCEGYRKQGCYDCNGYNKECKAYTIIE